MSNIQMVISFSHVQSLHSLNSFLFIEPYIVASYFKQIEKSFFDMILYSVLYLLCKMLRKEYRSPHPPAEENGKNKGWYTKNRKNLEGWTKLYKLG